MIKYIPVLVALIVSLSGFANEPCEQTIEEKVEALVKLDWKGPGKHTLPKSNSTLAVPEGYVFLVGEEAKKEAELVDISYGTDTIESVVYDKEFENRIIFESIETGYVSVKDWSDVSSQSLMSSLIENTEEANKIRKAKGTASLHIVGWIQEPALDKHTNTVYWAIEGFSEEDKDKSFVNSIALRLGREGYERLCWITSKNEYVPFGGHLDVMLRAHSFNPGHRYTDYKVGDHVAGYGIATLVAATVGAKVVKAGGLAILLKKVGAFLAAGIALAFSKIKGIFSSSNKNKDG